MLCTWNGAPTIPVLMERMKVETWTILIMMMLASGKFLSIKKEYFCNYYYFGEYADFFVLNYQSVLYCLSCTSNDSLGIIEFL